MVIKMERTFRAVSGFERLSAMDKKIVMGTLAASLILREDRYTFMTLFNTLENEEKLIIESKIRELSK